MRRIKNSCVERLISGDINVKRLSIVKVIWILILEVLIHALLAAIITEVSTPLQGILSETEYIWYEFITIDIVIRFIVIIILIKMFTLCKEIDYVGKKLKLEYKDYILAIGIMISYILVTYGVVYEILNSLPLLSPFPEDVIIKLFQELESMPKVIQFITAVVSAAFFEEIVYRGIILNGLLKKYSPRRAIVYSAIVFGVIHMNLPQGINAFIGGLIFGVIYHYSRSLLLCMTMHAANNFLVDFIFVPENMILKIILYIIIPIIGIILFKVCCEKLNLRQRAINEGIIL